ncbi:hypothetical protein D3C78_1889600 [compost metagenome]
MKEILLSIDKGLYHSLHAKGACSIFDTGVGPHGFLYTQNIVVGLERFVQLQRLCAMRNMLALVFCML